MATSIDIGVAPEGPQTLALKRANRHGLIAGATGTGKTVTLQLLAEEFARNGVNVFAADIKGDLSGVAVAAPTPVPGWADARAKEIGVTITPEAQPVVFWDVYGELGHPVRTTITEMGPVLMASGDDVFIAETRPLFAQAEWVQTKVAHGQGSGVTLSPAASRKAIAQAAERAVRAALSRKGADKVEPFRIPGPIECQLQTQSTALADLFCTWPTLERVDGVTLRFTADTVQAAIRTLNSLSAMSFILR